MKKILTRYISADQRGVFSGNGWTVSDDVHSSDPDQRLVRYEATIEVEFFDTDPSPLDLTRVLVRPQFVRRAQIKRPLGRYAGSHILQSMTFDFMSFDWAQSPACSEYDNHTLEVSLYRMRAQRFAYRVDRFEDFNVLDKDRTFALRIFHGFNREELARYCGFLLDIRSARHTTLDPTGLEALTGLPHGPDLWWDLDNDVIITFDKNYAFRINEMLLQGAH